MGRKSQKSRSASQMYEESDRIKAGLEGGPTRGEWYAGPYSCLADPWVCCCTMLYPCGYVGDVSLHHLLFVDKEKEFIIITFVGFIFLCY